MQKTHIINIDGKLSYLGEHSMYATTKHLRYNSVGVLEVLK